jgi:hypothetical protein
MNQNTWLDIFNSATTFGVLTVIAVCLLIIVSKLYGDSKSSNKK